MENFLLYYILIAICILFSVFFSGIETAIISARRLTIETLSGKGHRRAVRGIYILDHVEEAVGMVLIGNNIVNVSAVAFITYVLTQGYRLGDSYIIIATIIETLFFLFFCEIIPKIVSKSKAESFLMFFSFQIIALMVVFKPFVRISLFFTGKMKKKFNIEVVKNGFISSRDDITTFFSIGHKEGIIDIDNKFYVSEILSFNETCAYEVMIPINNVVSIDINSSIKDLAELIEKTKFSRIPVYRRKKNNICGYIYYRDILKKNIKNIEDILQEPVFIPETKNIFELYNEMLKRKRPMLFTVDEYGNISGFLTFEDIAEEIVGDIDTADHSVENTMIKINDKRYALSGALDIDYFIRYFGIDIKKKHFETLAGFLLSINGEIPEKGDHIHYNDYEFIVDEMNNMAVERVIMNMPGGKKR